MSHPREALFEAGRRLPVLPACDHYAGTERRMQKALQLQARAGGRFDVTLDLEDGAPTGFEADHARRVVELLNSELNPTGRGAGRVGVRVHDPEHDSFAADVDSVVRGAGRRLAYLTIPKVGSARQAATAINAVQSACAAAGRSGELPLHLLIETHGALRDVERIAALPWLASLEFGLMDFISAHHGAIPESAMRSPGQFEHALVRRAKTLIASAALAQGLVPSHNVSVDVDDPASAGADAARARREFGFLRMWSIHPGQIEPILDAFAPAPDAVTLAAEVLLAGAAADWAPIRHAGRLHDRASFRYCWHVLERAHLDGGALPDEARDAFFAG